VISLKHRCQIHSSKYCIRVDFMLTNYERNHTCTKPCSSSRRFSKVFRKLNALSIRTENWLTNLTHVSNLVSCLYRCSINTNLFVDACHVATIIRSLQKHKGWFNQPWLPQLQFKTAKLCSRNIWEGFRGHAKVSNCKLLKR